MHRVKRGSLSLRQYLSCSDPAVLVGGISDNMKVKIGGAQEPHCVHSHNSHADLNLIGKQHYHYEIGI